MDLRTATHEDSDGIRAVADASLEATYADALGEDIVDAAADEWYADDRLAERMDNDAVVYLVVADGEEVVAFSESELEGEAAGTIEWLHVHPDYRDRGLGGRLLEYTESTLLERGANRIEGRVLAANEGGNEFYQSRGYARKGDRTLEVGGVDYTEHRYLKLPDGTEAPELTETREVADGTVYVAYDDRERGSEAPFYATYRTKDREDRYGFYCANCGSTDTTMGSMGEVQCSNCGNTRKATRWDAAYL